MKIKQQTVSPGQFEVIDDDSRVLSCHDTNEMALAAMAKITIARSTPKAEASLFSVMPTSISDALATAKELKQQQKREG